MRLDRGKGEGTTAAAPLASQVFGWARLVVLIMGALGGFSMQAALFPGRNNGFPS